MQGRREKRGKGRGEEMGEGREEMRQGGKRERGREEYRLYWALFFQAGERVC